MQHDKRWIVERFVFQQASILRRLLGMIGVADERLCAICLGIS